MTNQPTFDTSRWRVEQLRLTAFTTDAVSLENKDWWAEVIGAPPDSETSRPKEARVLVRGQIGGDDVPRGILTLSIEQSRIDWLLAPVPAEDDPFPDLGQVPSAVDGFHKTLAGWLSSQEVSIQRVAFGGVFSFPVETYEEAYNVLSENFLNFAIDPTSADFMYRVNHPYESHTLRDGTLVNQLRTWSVVKMGAVVITASVSGAEFTSTAEPVIKCQLELDINTAKQRAESLPSDSLEELMTELQGSALSLAHFKEG